MKRQTKWLVKILAGGGGLILAGSALAATTIATFDENFYLDGLFANWAAAPIVSDPTGYTITATGYGSGYKDINPNIDASGETTVELRVTISATTAITNPARSATGVA